MKKGIKVQTTNNTTINFSKSKSINKVKDDYNTTLYVGQDEFNAYQIFKQDYK